MSFGVKHYNMYINVINNVIIKEQMWLITYGMVGIQLVG